MGSGCLVNFKEETTVQFAVICVIWVMGQKVNNFKLTVPIQDCKVPSGCPLIFLN